MQMHAMNLSLGFALRRQIKLPLLSVPKEAQNRSEMRMQLPTFVVVSLNGHAIGAMLLRITNCVLVMPHLVCQLSLRNATARLLRATDPAVMRRLNPLAWASR